MAKMPTTRPGRNDLCHCGSGKKYKKCCLEKDETADRVAREKVAAKAAKAAAKAAEQQPESEAGDGDAHAAPTEARRRRTDQPWKRGAPNAHGFQRINAPRKIGSG